MNRLANQFVDIGSIPVQDVRSSFASLDAGADIESQSLVDFLQAELDRTLENDDLIASVFAKIAARYGRAVIFGGWVRDHLALRSNPRQPRPRDIDIVVASEIENLEDFVGSPDFRPTIFGGVNFKAASMEVDVWSLGQTFIFERYAITPSFDRLPNISDFTINSIIFRPAQFWGHASIRDSGCLDALDKGEVTFQYHRISYPRIQAARAIIYAAKLNLRLSPEVREFVEQQIADKPGSNDILDGIQKFCPDSARPFALSIFEELRNK